MGILAEETLVIMFFRLLLCSVNSKKVYCNCACTKTVYH
jgi:hypothetical protein